MERIRVCRGCFAEMNAQDTKCCKCGWKVGEVFERKHRWCLGDVLEKRYLVGNLYYESQDGNIAVFYMYDRLIAASCMALLCREEDKTAYMEIAGRLQPYSQASEGKLVLQTIKKIQEKYVLFFSIENHYMDKDEFEWCLNTGVADRRSVMVERKGYERKNALPSGMILDERYRIIECIGVGGFGITYLCEDVLLNRLVAVKEYFPAEWAERDDTYVMVKQSKMLSAYRYGKDAFLKEIAISGKFMHTPHIPAVYDVLEANDTIYMVMEYIDGISVGRMMKIREYKPMKPAEVKDIILPVLDALEAVHDQKIVHSDISPGNILYTERGEIYLIDMGAAKYVLDSQPSLDAIFLKIEYAAPEQYRTAAERVPADEGPWTDIYALGATMYFMLTGNKPTDVISRLNGTDSNLKSCLEGKLSAKWGELLEEAMVLERTERIQSVPELRRKIQKLRED